MLVYMFMQDLHDHDIFVSYQYGTKFNTVMNAPITNVQVIATSHINEKLINTVTKS